MNVVLPYMPPNPPAGDTHHYVIEIYSQTSLIRPVAAVKRTDSIDGQGLTFVGSVAFYASSRAADRSTSTRPTNNRANSYTTGYGAVNSYGSSNFRAKGVSGGGDDDYITERLLTKSRSSHHSSGNEQFFPSLSGDQAKYCSCLADIAEKNLVNPNYHADPYKICSKIPHQKGLCGPAMVYWEMPLELLQAELSLYKLDTSGSRAALIKRMQDYKANH